MLDHIPQHHGRPTHDELANAFATDFIGPEPADRFARALELFWDGYPDESAHVLVPRLDAVIRDIAREAGITISKPATEGRFAGVISLNVVLDRLRERDDALPWFDYLAALLCDPLALNLRNDIAHGIVPCVRKGHAALLLHAAAFLTRFHTRSEAQDEV